MSGKINKNNYEAFVLDYMEGNLSEELTAELKAFVLIHPELEIDLEDTELFSLEIENVLYSGKENLKKMNPSINDEQFVAYIENELNANEKANFEKTVAADKFLQKELAIYKHTILAADSSVVFADKASLKRKPKVLWFQSTTTLSMAAAIILIFGLWFMFRDSFGTEKTNTNELANKTNTISKNETSNKEAAPVSQTVELVKEESKQLASNSKSNFTSKKKVKKGPKTNTVEIAVTNTLPSVANNSTVTTNEPKETILPKKVEEQPVFAANSKPNFIVSQGSDEEELINPEPSKHQGLLARAGKALRGLNKLGVKNVNAVEDIKKNKEEYVLSLGTFSIKQNKYTQN